MMNSTLHTSTPNVPGQVSTSPSPSPSPSPLQTTEQEDTDFAFGHHLSLPVDSAEGRDSEVVFPRHYSWTTDHGEVAGASGSGGGGGGGGGGVHGIRLQLEQNGNTLQVMIDSGDLDVGGGGVLNVSNDMDEGEREDREEEQPPAWF